MAKKRTSKADEKEELKGVKEKKKGGKRKATELSEEEAQKLANDLAQDMDEAVTSDNSSNQEGVPALKKLLMLEDVTRKLRKQLISEKFINLGGCQILGRWLEPLPDGTYPNQKVVTEILHCINSL